MTLLAPVGPATAQSVPFTAPENPPVEFSWPGYGASAIGAVRFPGVLATGGVETPRSGERSSSYGPASYSTNDS